MIDRVSARHRAFSASGGRVLPCALGVVLTSVACGPVWAGKVVSQQLIQSAPLAAQSTAQESWDLREIPVPNLESEDDAVRQQLVRLRAALDRLLGADPQREQLARAMGELGAFYLLYDFKEAALACMENATLLEPNERRWRYLRGVLLQTAGRDEEALSQLQVVLAADPTHMPSLIRKGRMLYDLGRYEDAATTFREALGNEPENAAALGGLGNVEVRLGRYQDAIPRLRQAIQLQPGADSLYYSLATALRATGDVAAGREAFAKNKSGRLLFDDPVMQEIRGRSASREGLFHAGNSAMRAGDMKAATQYLEAFVLAEPDHRGGRYSLALAYVQLERREEALAIVRELLREDPDLRGGHRLIAEVLSESGQLEASLPHFEKAFDADPKQTATAADWATVLAKLGRIEQATDLLKPYADPASQHHYARLKYATILATSGKGAEAVPILRDIASSEGLRRGLRSEALYHLGSLELTSGETEAAVRTLERSLELDPDSLQGLAALAPVLGRRGELDRAAQLYERIVRIDPADERSQFGRAMSLLLADRESEAVLALEEALEQLPDNDALQHALARLLATARNETVRDPERALSMARQLLQQSPNPEFAQTVAMALAANGEYQQAVALQQQVVQRAEAAGRLGADHAERRHRLELYRAEKMVLSPWKVNS